MALAPITTELTVDELKEAQSLLLNLLDPNRLEAIKKTYGPLTVTGVYDDPTQGAVFMYRTEHGPKVSVADLLNQRGPGGKAILTRDILAQMREKSSSKGSWFGRNWGYLVAGVAVVAIGGGAYMISKED